MTLVDLARFGLIGHVTLGDVGVAAVKPEGVTVEGSDTPELRFGVIESHRLRIDVRVDLPVEEDEDIGLVDAVCYAERTRRATRRHVDGGAEVSEERLSDLCAIGRAE